MSVVAVTGEELRGLGKNSLDDILSNVGSAVLQTAGDGFGISQGRDFV